MDHFIAHAHIHYKLTEFKKRWMILGIHEFVDKRRNQIDSSVFEHTLIFLLSVAYNIIIRTPISYFMSQEKNMKQMFTVAEKIIFPKAIFIIKFCSRNL